MDAFVYSLFYLQLIWFLRHLYHGIFSPYSGITLRYVLYQDTYEEYGVKLNPFHFNSFQLV